MKSLRPALLLCLLPAACAAPLGDGGEVITVQTAPSGAACTLDRGGASLGALGTTPGRFTVAVKNDLDIHITCTKPGYLPASAVDAADQTPYSLPNLLTDGALASFVQTGDGADYHYRRTVLLPLTPG